MRVRWLVLPIVSLSFTGLHCGGQTAGDAELPNCPVDDPYQKPCAEDGASCLGVTSCPITPTQILVCDQGVWYYPHGTPDNCGDSPHEHDANLGCLCTDTTCPSGQYACHEVDPPLGCDSSLICCETEPSEGLDCGDAAVGDGG